MGPLEAVVICSTVRSSMERKPSRIYRHLVIEFVDSDHRKYNVTSAGRADQILRCECFRRIWGATLAGLAFSPFHPFILGMHDHPGHHRLGIITGERRLEHVKPEAKR